jgi:hypothetical protein
MVHRARREATMTAGFTREEIAGFRSAMAASIERLREDHAQERRLP